MKKANMMLAIFAYPYIFEAKMIAGIAIETQYMHNIYSYTQTHRERERERKAQEQLLNAIG